MSSLRKVLLAMLLVSLTGSAFGAGTFASFTATTTNAGSAFATGSLVLQNGIGSNTCFSNTEAADHDSAALAGAAGDTDDNSNDACSAVFTAGIAKPGDESTNTITLTNSGSLAADSGVVLYGTAACTNGQRAGETFFGTGNMCQQLQLKVQDDAGGAGACKYGLGAGSTYSGSAISALATPAGTVTINSTTDNLRVTVDAVNYDLDIADGTYNYSTGAVNGTGTTLAGALMDAAKAWNSNAGAPLLFGVGPDQKVYVASSAVGTQTITLTSWNGDTQATVLNNLGLAASPTLVLAGNQATCGYSPAHTVGNLFNRFKDTANGLSVITGSWAAAASKTFTVAVKLDSAAGNNIQGKSATWSMSWLMS